MINISKYIFRGFVGNTYHRPLLNILCPNYGRSHLRYLHTNSNLTVENISAKNIFASKKLSDEKFLRKIRQFFLPTMLISAEQCSLIVKNLQPWPGGVS